MIKADYNVPKVVDYGTVEELTASCIGGAGSDELGKQFTVLEPLTGSQPFLGICVPGSS